MEKQFQQVKDSLNRLDLLHELHIESFRTDLMPDLESQTDERNHEFARLKKSLNKLLTRAETGNDINIEPMSVYVADQITTLLEQNRRLEQIVKGHRNELKKRMKQVSKGKKAIGFYGSADIAGNKPRIISSSR
jgi:uncharacterized phage infection (PIP) family protein YhgE